METWVQITVTTDCAFYWRGKQKKVKATVLGLKSNTWFLIAPISMSSQPEACTSNKLGHWRSSLSGNKIQMECILVNATSFDGTFNHESKSKWPGWRLVQELRFRSSSSGQFTYKPYKQQKNTTSIIFAKEYMSCNFHILFLKFSYGILL